MSRRVRKRTLEKEDVVADPGFDFLRPVEQRDAWYLERERLKAEES